MQMVYNIWSVYNIEERMRIMTKKKSTKFLIPLILLLTVVPQIVYIYEYDSNLTQFDWSASYDIKWDFFMYYKSVAVITIAAVMCLLLAYRYKARQKEFKLCYEFIPVVVYAAFTFLSSIFSQYRYFSFHGASEVFESLWVLLSYCVIAFYAYQFIDTFEELDYVMKWLTVGLAVMLVIGLAQALGHDFYTSKIGQKIITGGIGDVDLTFEKGRVFLSVYNPNYVASYFALMIPVEIALFIQNKKWQYRVIYAVMFVASLVCLLASGNRSGIVAFAVTIVLVILLFAKKILKAWKLVVPGIAVAAAVFAVFLSKNDFIIEKFVRLFSAEDMPEDPISKIVTEEDVAITYYGEVFHVSYRFTEEGYVNVEIYDDAGEAINSTLDEATYTYTIQDERFPGFTVQAVNLNEEVAVGVNADNKLWYFKRGEDDTFYYYNVFGRWDKINNAPRVATQFLEKKFEERGTIWSKTIPMLKHCILFGTGADTYTVTYPQDDYVNKVYDNSTAALDVKPHCFYLQVATQSGIPAMIAVIVFYVWYFVKSVRLYKKASYEDGTEVIGAGLLCATFTYMVISFLNDSTVAVAPIFWIMMGLGISVNEMVKRKQEQQ
jgi:Lipid A core - O-antigen ligase and related enzymes